MRQPSVYSREQIIEASLELIREQGWGATTTRAIARKLGSSTMPIYSQFSSREALEAELRERARALLAEYQRRRHTEHRLLNAAFGYVVFARDEGNLFRFLFLEAPAVDERKGPGVLETFTKEHGGDVLSGTILADLPRAAQEALVEHTWIFTHGLAMLVNAGRASSFGDERVLDLLGSAGQAFYLLEVTREKMEKESTEEG